MYIVQWALSSNNQETKSMSTSRLCTALLLLYLITNRAVRAKYEFTVLFYEYFNPTGLCGECGNSGIPACCDNFNLTANCLHLGTETCDTAFRFIQRPFGASVEKAPNIGYQDFTRSRTNEHHETFKQGPGGFLSLPNPHTRANRTAWTGRIQLHIDALDRAQGGNETQRIIDRFPIDLELQLGANLTQRTSYFGIYNISQLDMSFRVQCSEHYYGPDCTKFCEPVEGQYICESDGTAVCIQAKRDPTTGCTKCFPGLDLLTNCMRCLPAYDPATNCTKCRQLQFDPQQNCSTCLKLGHDPRTNCTQCLPGRDPATNCTQCLLGYDSNTDCAACLPGRDPTTNCTECLPRLNPKMNCTGLLPPVNDVTNNDTTCSYGYDSVTTNCTQCLPGRDMDTNCTTCLYVYDPTTNCSLCLDKHRDPSTGCTECFAGYTGENCSRDPCTNQEQLCKNGGTCTLNTTTGDYHCQCVVGFEGQNCTTKTTRNLTTLELVLAVVLGVSLAVNFMVLLALLCKFLCSKSSKDLPKSIGKPVPEPDEELRNNEGYGVIGLGPISRTNDDTYYNVTESDSIRPIHNNAGNHIHIQPHTESIYEHMV